MAKEAAQAEVARKAEEERVVRKTAVRKAEREAARSPMASHNKVQRQLTQALKKRDAMAGGVHEAKRSIVEAYKVFKEATAKLDSNTD